MRRGGDWVEGDDSTADYPVAYMNVTIWMNTLVSQYMAFGDACAFIYTYTTLYSRHIAGSCRFS